MSAGTITVDAEKVLDLLDRIAKPLEARAQRVIVDGYEISLGGRDKNLLNRKKI